MSGCCSRVSTQISSINSKATNKTTDIQKCICDKTYLQFRGAMSQDRLCNVAILTEYRKRQTLDELVITLLTFFCL